MKILLSNGEWALVNDEDWLYLVGFSWHKHTKGYTCCRVAGETCLMHRVVAERAGIDCSDQIDHINRDKLDNRRCNLRSATGSQNHCNSKLQCNNTSGITGVYWIKKDQKWFAQIRINNRHIYLGRFDTKEQATFARRAAAKKYHKEFANTGE